MTGAPGAVVRPGTGRQPQRPPDRDWTRRVALLPRHYSRRRAGLSQRDRRVGCRCRTCRRTVAVHRSPHRPSRRAALPPADTSRTPAPRSPRVSTGRLTSAWVLGDLDGLRRQRHPDRPTNGPTVDPADESSPQVLEAERTALVRALGHVYATDVEHVESTSISRMSAKPIIYKISSQLARDGRRRPRTACCLRVRVPATLAMAMAKPSRPPDGRRRR